MVRPPQRKAIHLIADNYATQKHPKVKRRPGHHPSFQVYFTPSSSSWLNRVERFFEIREPATSSRRSGVPAKRPIIVGLLTALHQMDSGGLR
jgi:transposase